MKFKETKKNIWVFIDGHWRLVIKKTCYEYIEVSSKWALKIPNIEIGKLVENALNNLEK